MRAFLAALLLLPILASGQGSYDVAGQTDRIEHYLDLYSRTDGSGAVTDKVLSFVEKLALKRTDFRQDKDFLEYLFFKIHQRYLKNYEDYATFGGLVSKRTYNCLTATALYALLLDRFNIDYRVIETNYHIFLLAYTNQGEVLFETTDPTNGFVSDAEKIEKRVTQYKQNRIQGAETAKKYYQYNFDLYNEVNLDQMLGLLHYNLSISAYNEQNLPVAIDQLTRAVELYYSPRIEEFSRIILLSVLESKLDEAVKETCLERIQSLRKRQFVVSASTN